MYDKKEFIVISTTAGDFIPVGCVVRFFQPFELKGNYELDNNTGGDMTGNVDNYGNIEMSYFHMRPHHAALSGFSMMTKSNMENGKIRLTDDWQWSAEEKIIGTRVWEEV